MRQIAYLYRGDPHKADECRREVEVLLLQGGTRQFYQDTTLEVEFMCYACSDDLLGLRRALPELERMAQAFPGWRVAYLLARGELARIRGHHEEALATYEEALQLVEPGKHTLWGYTQAFRVEALVELGRAAEGRAFGYAAIALAAQHGIQFVSASLHNAVARAETALENYSAAIAHLDGLIEHGKIVNVSGLFTGMVYEQRAELALLVHDVPGFWCYYQQCSEHFGTAIDSPFTQRLARLRAREHSATATHAPTSARAPGVSPERARRELSTCPKEERASLALSLLLEATGAESGHLYGIQVDGLMLLASSGDPTSGESLIAPLERLLGSGMLSELDQTQWVDDEGATQALQESALCDAAGLPHSAFSIALERGRDQLLVAVAALCGVRDSGDDLSELLTALGEQLFERGNVTGFTLLK